MSLRVSHLVILGTVFWVAVIALFVFMQTDTFQKELAASGADEELALGDGWQETKGRVSSVMKLKTGDYAYVLTYEMPHKEKNKEGKFPTMWAMVAGAEKAPLEGQVIKMAYMTEEPVIFRRLGELQFVDEIENPIPEMQSLNTDQK